VTHTNIQIRASLLLLCPYGDPIGVAFLPPQYTKKQVYWGPRLDGKATYAPMTSMYTYRRDALATLIEHFHESACTFSDVLSLPVFGFFEPSIDSEKSLLYILKEDY